MPYRIITKSDKTEGAPSTKRFIESEGKGKFSAGCSPAAIRTTSDKENLMWRNDEPGSIMPLVLIVLLTVGIILGITFWLLRDYIVPWFAGTTPYSYAIIPLIIGFIAFYFFSQ